MKKSLEKFNIKRILDFKSKKEKINTIIADAFITDPLYSG